ncbi:MAG: alpha/beta hydrolase [Candidatus Diapherotrites archaeon]|nr:alpha/beta hydrolase [Candidatus Diapherotrites archaeon]
MAVRVIWETHKPMPKVRGTKRRVPRQAARKYRLTRIMLGGTPVNVRLRHRPGNKAPIVILPGLACSQADFARVFRMPELRGHEIISFDYPGQFRALVPKGFRPSLESLADLTKAVFDRFKLKNAIIVGHSTGGAIGTLFAERHPELVDTLINMEGIGWFMPTRIRPSQIQYSMDLFRTGHDRKTIEGYTDSLYDHYDSNRLPGRFLSRDAKKVRKVFVYGSDGRGDWRKQAEGKAELVEIPDAGHFMFKDNPNYFFRKLAEIINRK